MQTPSARRNGVFQKVGECLYRYSSNGVYHARIKTGSKEIRRSLETVDRDVAKRKLAVLKQELAGIDHSKGKLTLVALCEQYLQTVAHLRHKTLERKRHIVRRLQKDWPNG